MHNVFHALQLKPTVGYDGSNVNAANVLSLCPAADESGQYKVEDILDYHFRGDGRS